MAPRRLIHWNDDKGFHCFWTHDATWTESSSDYDGGCWEEIFRLPNGWWILEQGYSSNDKTSARHLTVDEALGWLHANALYRKDNWPADMKTAAEARKVGAFPPGAATLANGGQEDLSAYCPKSWFFSERFPTDKSIDAFLKKHNKHGTTIRTRAPRPQRLDIHAGDWMRAVAKADGEASDAADRLEKVVTKHLEEVERSKETARRSRLTGG